MKGFVITHKGIEDVTSLEIKELIKSKGEEQDRVVVFDFKKFEDLFLLSYRMQSASKVGLLLDSFTSKDLFDEIIKKVKKLDLEDWIWKNAKVSISCIRAGDHLFTSQDVSRSISSIFYKKNMIVDYKNPDVVFFVFINNDKCYFGIDFSGINLAKRDYKIFINQRSLKAPIAYALMRFADIKSKEVIVDPFVRSGETVIEAGLYFAKISPWYYNKEKFAFMKLRKFEKIDFEKFFEKEDKKSKKSKFKLYGYDSMMRNIMAANKNAKIAGINKQVSLTRKAIDWIDLKFKKGTVDKIITQLPPMSKRVDHSTVRKTYDYFFNQAEYVLKKKGIVVVACLSSESIEDIAKHYHFKIQIKKEVWQGEQRDPQ